LLKAYKAELDELRNAREKREKGVMEEQRNPKPGQVETGDEKRLIEPTTKPKRNIFAGLKGQVEKLKRGTETRPTPSG